MKVLIFSHKSDIDGMGGVVLAKLAFDDVTYVLTETFNLAKELEERIIDKSIYNYDLVFVTDLWLEEPVLSKIAQDKKLKDKFYLFDHHESALNEGVNNYSFVKIEIKNELGLCCGTSLYYAYLCEKGYLEKDNSKIKEFVELTRLYDTWEWKNIYNNEMAHELTLLFYALGGDAYINLMVDKLQVDGKFAFSKIEQSLIDNKKANILEKVKNYANKGIYKEILGLKAGIYFIAYEDRNDLVEYLRDIKCDIDFVMMFAMDYGTISYRSMHNDVNVRVIASHFGGKGHDHAASSPISIEQKNAMVNIITNGV